MYLYKNKFVTLIFLSFCFQSICNAELIKPKNSIKPLEVVEIQLNGLKNNNEPYEDFGIEQTWEFAHPITKNIQVHWKNLSQCSKVICMKC